MRRRPNGERCARQYCGAVLDVTYAPGSGQAAVICRPCERNSSGLCRDCPARLERPNALRCRRCSSARTRKLVNQTSAAVYARDRLRILARQKRRNQRPEVRQRRQEYMRTYNAEYFAGETGRHIRREYMRNWRAGKGKRHA